MKRDSVRSAANLIGQTPHDTVRKIHSLMASYTAALPCGRPPGYGLVMPMKLKRIEEEVIFLTAIYEIIDSMLNLEILSLNGSDPDCSIVFKSSTHMSFFNIVLVDFLSTTDNRAPVRRTSYLDALCFISEDPSFSIRNSIEQLRLATKDFVDWLQQTVEVDIWLPSMDTKTTLKISRLTFLKMCGNISKHNFLRSAGVAKDVQKTLAESGISMEMDDALLSLHDFHGRFHSDILGYHGSTIAEFLNNIRWGIYDYLQPEFQSSIIWDKGDPLTYRYTYQEGVSTKLAQECYWRLMNDVRRQPNMRKFQVTRWLRIRY